MVRPLTPASLRSCFGLLGIVGPLEIVGVVIERAFRDVGIGDLAEAEGHRVDDGLLVDGVVERLAHLLLVERRVLVIDQKMILAGRRVEMDDEIRDPS